MPKRRERPPGAGDRTAARRVAEPPELPEDQDGSPGTGELDELLRFEDEHAGRPAVLRMLRARRERLRAEHGKGGGAATP